MTPLRTRHVMVAGGLLVLLVNAWVLAGVAWNRSGEPDSVLTAGSRELPLSNIYGRADNSGISLYLTWRVLPDPPDAANRHDPYYPHGHLPHWLDQDKMLALGFALPPADAARRYRQEPARAVFVVLELAGPAWQAARARARAALADSEARQRALGTPDAERQVNEARAALAQEEQQNSRLFAVDAGLDAARLREKYPDRTQYAVVAATIRPTLLPATDPRRPELLRGYISNLSAALLHVPVQFHDPLRTVASHTDWSARIAFGRRLEPWLLSVQAAPAATTP